jgi:organic hydroperoxide reductase OsmC/OhrA
VSTPPEFQGEAGLWTPEHLFVAAAEACLMATFIAIAENSRLRVVDYHSTAFGVLERVEREGLRFTELVILPVVEVESLEGKALAERLMAKAERACLIANSVKAALRVEPKFQVRPAKVAA